MYEPVPEKVELIASHALECAFKVHRNLGPGLLESAYHACLRRELLKQSIVFESEVIVPIIYDGEKIDEGYRLDIWIDRKVILELKTVKEILDIHRAQVLTYLKLSGTRLGFILNFNSVLLKDGIERFVL